MQRHFVGLAVIYLHATILRFGKLPFTIMPKKAAAANGKPLLIVESPAKARTIHKFLGGKYTIEASIGHIRDLPQGAKEVPAPFKKEPWAYLGVNVEHNFEPIYVIPKEKAAQVRKLKQLLKKAGELYLATDEDREGEAISWHLCEVLQPQVPVHRLVFHEITAEAVREALKKPRSIDHNLVRAQEVRRIVDRLFGYDVSPLLWRKIRPRLSAGRVQSVAVRLIVERERERMAFVPAGYWDLAAVFSADGRSFPAMLIKVSNRRLPSSRDFDPATGRLINPELLLLDQTAAENLAKRLREGGDFRVSEVEDKPYTTRPYPPFTTSTLQQEANRKFGFTARRTMQLAQSLYENGHITYMRTDSTSLADAAIEAARHLILTLYGKQYLPPEPRIYQTKVKNAQEAHEAIRPAGHPFVAPEALRKELSPDEFKLYDLIWKRTMACQMSDAQCRRLTVTVTSNEATFQATGKVIEFPGYLRVYVEGSDDPEAELADREQVLPKVEVGQTVECLSVEARSHTTQPPLRYSEASLTRALEELGIGRPSTYATIIDTIQERGYVFKVKRSNALAPTWTAFAVAQLLTTHLPQLVDYQFTAEMEDELDAISRGEMNYLDYLRTFYYGNDHPGLKQLLTEKQAAIDARDVCRIFLGKPKGTSRRDAEIYVRVGRFGPFLEQGSRRAKLPDNMPPDELTIPVALEILDKAEQHAEPLGYCPETKQPVFLKHGRYGPYVQLGTGEDGVKPRNASLLKGMDPKEVDLETALRLLSLPRTLGVHPETNEPVVASNGRYGPYVKCGKETRRLPDGCSPLDITLKEALHLLAQPKPLRGSRSSEPLRQFDPSPVTGQPVRLLKGRFGLYLTDSQTNAMLPKTVTPEELTFEYALYLLEQRAKKGPAKSPKKRTRKKKAISD